MLEITGQQIILKLAQPQPATTIESCLHIDASELTIL